jgi:hypothetical protein
MTESPKPAGAGDQNVQNTPLGVVFFSLGVVFFLTMDSPAIGLPFIALGIAFFSMGIAAARKAGGDGPDGDESPPAP